VETGRCRARLEAWELANLPRMDPAALAVTGWMDLTPALVYGPSVDLPRLNVPLAEDAISLVRAGIGDYGPIAADVCRTERGVTVALRSRAYPQRLAQELESVFRRGLAAGPYAPHGCAHVAFSYVVVAQ
jgi:hypothetical protein